MRPLSVDEREDVLADLEDLEIFQRSGAARRTRAGRRLPDCEEPTYFEWDLLRGNLQAVASTRVSRMSTSRRSSRIRRSTVSWDYARGFSDAILDLDDD